MPKIKPFNAAFIDSKVLAQAARVTYDAWIKLAGFQNDARIKEWDKLNPIHQGRWTAIARAVIESYETSRVAGKRGGKGDAPNDGARPDPIRNSDGGAQSKVLPDRNRGARRRRKA